VGKEHTILWLGISIGFRGSGRGGGGLAEVVYDATKLSPRGLPSKHEAIPAARTTGVGDLACSEREFAGDTRLYQALLPAGDSGEDSRGRYRLQQRQLLRLHRPLGGNQAQDLSFGYSKFSKGEIFLGSLKCIFMTHN